MMMNKKKVKNELLEGLSKAGEMLLTTKDFNQEFKSHIRLTKESVAEGKIKSFMPRLIVSSIDDAAPTKRCMAIIGLGDLPDSNADKRMVMAQLAIACAANDLKVVMAVFESEAWTAKETRDPETIPEKEWVRPSERPDRQEVIMVAARSIDGRDAFATIPITGRGPDESLILGEETVHEFVEKREEVVKDSLLSMFFEVLVSATFAKLQVDVLLAEGKEVPEPLQQLVLMMDQCPVKLKK